MQRQTFVADNGVTGFDMHKLDTAIHLRNYYTGPAVDAVPKDVHFANNGELVVGGSDHGRIYVFEAESGQKIDTLQHATCGLVQAIAVRWLFGGLRYLLVSQIFTDT